MSVGDSGKLLVPFLVMIDFASSVTVSLFMAMGVVEKATSLKPVPKANDL